MPPANLARYAFTGATAVVLAGCAPGRPLPPVPPSVVPVRAALRPQPLRPLPTLAADRSTDVLESPFAQDQLRHARVLDAHAATRTRIERLFQDRGIAFPAAEVYLRVFKQNRALELWVRPDGGERFALLRTYRICALAGQPGPKHREGDTQVPEGFYTIDAFKPDSEYHLSLRIDYPNTRDRRAASGARDLGGDIYIHGGCRSEGCLAITDDSIQELYTIALMARAAGQARIPVHIFPGRLDTNQWRHTESEFAGDRALLEFWSTLRPGYQYFQREQRVPRVVVSREGRYQLLD